MQLIVVTFVLVAGLVYGLYWFFIERVESEEQHALRSRLKRPGKSRSVVGALLKQEERLSDVDAFDTALGKVGGLTAPLQRTISQAGLKVTVSTVLLGSGVLALVTYAVVVQFLHIPLVGVALAVFAACAPYTYISFMRGRRMLQFEEQFPEAIDLLSRALRAGHALTTGLSMVADEMKEPVGPEFRQLFDEQNFGRPLDQALKSFALRIPTIDARFFVTAVLTQREAGGNLSEVLDNLARIIRDRFRVKRQVRVISAHGRITGWVLSALPVTLGLIFAVMDPETYRTFYNDPLGVKMIIGALTLQIVGVFIIKKIVQIEY
jgi:tight adherence protein B